MDILPPSIKPLFIYQKGTGEKLKINAPDNYSNQLPGTYKCCLFQMNEITKTCTNYFTSHSYSLLLTPTHSYSLLLSHTQYYSLLLTPTQSSSLIITPTQYYLLLLTPTHFYSLLLTPANSY